MLAFDLLRRYGFKTQDDCDGVWNLRAKDAERLYESLVVDLYEHQYDGAEEQQSSFSFVASAHMRGAVGCQYLPCVQQKMQFLAHYAALYADTVFVPLPLLLKPTQSKPERREALYESVRALTILKPVIEAGLVRPVTMSTLHCNRHLASVKKLKKLIDQSADELQADVSEQVRVTYQKAEHSSTGEPTVYIEGPDELIEHGALVGTYGDGLPPFWVSKSWKYDREGKHLVPKSKYRNIWRFNQLFDEIASDTSFHLAFGEHFNARYLSNLPLEVALLDAMTFDPEVETSNKAVRELLSHIIPVVGHLSMREVVKLRKTEGESFLRYRAALTKIIDEFLRQHKKLTKKDAREIFHDYIEREVLNIEGLIFSKRKAASKQFVAGAAGLFASVAIGAFAVPFPPLVTAAVAGASSLLMGNAAKESLSHSPETANDFYFLLQAKNKNH